MKVKPDNGRNQRYHAWGAFDGEGVYEPEVQRLANEFGLYACSLLSNGPRQYFWLQPVDLV